MKTLVLVINPGNLHPALANLVLSEDQYTIVVTRGDLAELHRSGCNRSILFYLKAPDTTSRMAWDEATEALKSLKGFGLTPECHVFDPMKLDSDEAIASLQLLLERIDWIFPAEVLRDVWSRMPKVHVGV